MMRAVEEKYGHMTEEQQRAEWNRVAWECWDELSDEDKAIIDPPDGPRP